MLFLGEFRRRKVFQIAGMYAVIAWLLVQVIVNVEAPLSLPDWSDTLVIVLLAIGFPLVCLLAWVVDPGAERATAAAATNAATSSPPMVSYVVQGLVLLAVLYLVLDQTLFDDTAPAEAPVAAAGSTPGEAMQLTATLPDGVRFAIGEDFGRAASISPDGRYIAFAGADDATGTDSLYLRPVGSEEAIPLAGTEDGNSIFWSPDSANIGFYAQGELKVISLAGSLPRALAAATSRGGGTWNQNDVILASLENPGPIFRVPQDGSVPVPVTELDPQLERDHVFPQFLDDGEHFIYVATATANSTAKVYVGSLSSTERKLLLEGTTTVVFAAPDHVLFLEGAELMAQAFDAERFELTGEPVPIATNVQSPLSASRSGALAFRARSARPYPLLWIGTDGAELGQVAPPGYYLDPALSPDGAELAFASREAPGQPTDIVVLTIATGNTRRLTLDAVNDRAPLWSPDGESLVYLSLRRDAPGIYRKAASGIGAEELVLPSPGVAWPYQWPDSNLHYFAGITGNNALWTLAADGATSNLLDTRYNEVDGALSPDGQWYAYTQNETGRFQIYVTTYPPSTTKLVVTTQGGADPFWSADGSQLYYIKPSTAELMSVEVTPGNPPQFGALRRIHPGPFYYPDAHTFYLHPDGERIVIAPSSEPVADIKVLLNWQAAIR